MQCPKTTVELLQRAIVSVLSKPSRRVPFPSTRTSGNGASRSAAAWDSSNAPALTEPTRRLSNDPIGLGVQAMTHALPPGSGSFENAVVK